MQKQRSKISVFFLLISNVNSVHSLSVHLAAHWLHLVCGLNTVVIKSFVSNEQKEKQKKEEIWLTFLIWKLELKAIMKVIIMILGGG